MHKVILWRIIQFPFILAVIYLLTFLLAWVAPGDPFSTDTAKNLDPVVAQTMRIKYHAETPGGFLTYYSKQILFHADFGPSMQYREWSVNDIIKQSLPVSVTLGLFALLIAVVVGVTVGTMSAVKRGGFLDWASLSITLIGISLPGFVTAVALLMLAASLKMPVGGLTRFSDLVLPSIALSLGPMAYIARLTRVSMLDVLGTDYVRTGVAKGLSRTVVIWKHCLRNAFLPVLSFLGPAAAGTMTGSFVIEKVFNIPGIGQHFVNSVLNRDQTLLLGVTMVYSAFLLVFNLLVDIGYVFVDPRIDISGNN